MAMICDRPPPGRRSRSSETGKRVSPVLADLAACTARQSGKARSSCGRTSWRSAERILPTMQQMD
jgi:hypothetical protein